MCWTRIEHGFWQYKTSSAALATLRETERESCVCSVRLYARINWGAFMRCMATPQLIYCFVGPWPFVLPYDHLHSSCSQQFTTISNFQQMYLHVWMPCVPLLGFQIRWKVFTSVRYDSTNRMAIFTKDFVGSLGISFRLTMHQIQIVHEKNVITSLPHPYYTLAAVAESASDLTLPSPHSLTAAHPTCSSFKTRVIKDTWPRAQNSNAMCNPLPDRTCYIMNSYCM